MNVTFTMDFSTSIRINAVVDGLSAEMRREKIDKALARARRHFAWQMSRLEANHSVTLKECTWFLFHLIRRLGKLSLT